MKKIIMVSVLTFLCSQVISLDTYCYSENTHENFMDIHVDGASNLGKLSETFRVGVWLAHLDRNSYIFDKFFSEILVGTVQSTQPLASALRESKSLEDYKQELEKVFASGTKTRKQIENIIRTGQFLIIGHLPAAMPLWLSSSTDQRRYTDQWWTVSQNSPPKCYDYECVINGEIVTGWSKVIEYTLRFYRYNLGVKKLGYYLGHEQNKDWIGKEEEFYKLYEYTVKVAKNVDKNILVGGTGTWSWSAKRLPCDTVHYNKVGLSYCNAINGWAMDGADCKDIQKTEKSSCEPMNKNLIEYAKEKHLPIDFLNYHMFAMPPIGELYEKNVETMKEWMVTSNFSKDTIIYPADWAYWSAIFSMSRGSPQSYPFDQIDTEENAAYFISTVYYMDKANIKWHSHDFDITNPSKEKEVFSKRQSELIGDWAVFTRGQIIKPIYNSFRVLSVFAGKRENETPNRLQVSMPEDDYVIALSSQTNDKKTTRILLSNFIPDGMMKYQYLFKTFKPCMLSLGYTEEEYKTFMNIFNKPRKQDSYRGDVIIEDFKRFIRQTDFPYPFDNSKLKKELYSCSSALERKNDEIQNYNKKPRDIKLTISNLTAGQYTMKKYLIDKEHSNSCRQNKKTEEKPSNTKCGVNGEIDRKVIQIKQEAGKKAKQKVINYLIQKGYKGNEIETIEKVTKSCKMEIKCIESQIRKAHSLDLNKIISDLKVVNSIYQETKDQFLYNDSPESIDKINNSKGIALEIIEEKSTAIDFKEYQEMFKMEPWSVLLIEISMVGN